MTNAADPVYELSGKRIWVAGHRGMVGSALVRRLEHERCTVLSVDRAEVDLRRQKEVERWLEASGLDVVVIAAATVGGIFANDTRPAEFIYDNLAITTNIVEGARRAGVSKLLFLGSSCIYPKFAPQPMAEDALLLGALEPTNQWYAVAKIAGIKMCQAYRRQYGCDFISAIPTNLYGPGDTFDLTASHVLPALMMKVHRAKLERRPMVDIWGSGTPRREFMHVDDLADALVFLLRTYTDESHINIGTGEELSIADLAGAVARAVGYEGGFRYDTTKPDGMPRKLLDSSRLLSMGWRARIGLEEGIAQTYRWFLDHEPVGA